MNKDEINACEDTGLLKSLLSKAHRETAQAEYECLLANRRLDIAIDRVIESDRYLNALKEIQHNLSSLVPDPNAVHELVNRVLGKGGP